MKYLILSFLFFVNVAHSENWLNDTKILASSKEAYSLQSDCERISQEKCYDLGAYPSSVYSRVQVQVDDISKPIFSGQEITGYEKKTIDSIAIDSSKLSLWKADQLTLAAAKDKESSIQAALERIECGKRVIALLVVRNSVKQLSTTQVASINNIYAPIKGLIDTGSLVTAKELMLSISPDGTLITEEDKSDLVNEITKCL
jgi:hypothetical protein